MEYLVPCCSHPSTPTRASDQERRDVERANSANLRASDKASEGIPHRAGSTRPANVFGRGCEPLAPTPDDEDWTGVLDTPCPPERFMARAVAALPPLDREAVGALGARRNSRRTTGGKVPA